MRRQDMPKRTFISTHFIRCLSIAAFGLFVVGCTPANSEEPRNVVQPVKLLEIPDIDVPKLDSFIAEIDATDRATLSFQVAGEIAQIKVKMGEQVTAGALLAELDPTDYQLALDAKQAEYELASTAFQRALALYKQKLISADVFDQREADFKATSAALAQAKTNLAYTKITAPFDGVVSWSWVKEHQVVANNQPVLNLINNDVMDVVFSVPVSYVERYGLQHIASSDLGVVMDIHRSVIIPAQFKEISTQPDLDINSFRATATIVRPTELNLFSGMTAQVQLPNPTTGLGYKMADTAWISRTDHSGKLFRFIPESKTIESVEVVLNDEGLIVEGLSGGDLIVEAGVAQLAHGQQVKAWQKEAGI